MALRPGFLVGVAGIRWIAAALSARDDAADVVAETYPGEGFYAPLSTVRTETVKAAITSGAITVGKFHPSAGLLGLPKHHTVAALTAGPWRRDDAVVTASAESRAAISD